MRDAQNYIWCEKCRYFLQYFWNAHNSFIQHFWRKFLLWSENFPFFCWVRGERKWKCSPKNNLRVRKMLLLIKICFDESFLPALLKSYIIWLILWILKIPNTIYSSSIFTKLLYCSILLQAFCGLLPVCQYIKSFLIAVSIVCAQTTEAQYTLLPWIHVLIAAEQNRNIMCNLILN